MILGTTLLETKALNLKALISHLRDLHNALFEA